MTTLEINCWKAGRDFFGALSFKLDENGRIITKDGIPSMVRIIKDSSGGVISVLDIHDQSLLQKERTCNEMKKLLEILKIDIHTISGDMQLYLAKNGDKEVLVELEKMMGEYLTSETKKTIKRRLKEILNNECLQKVKNYFYI
ncbi:MAG: hypothetical protein N4A38_00165 [Candidatus Gracilibacteria bacterium]|nr:hypothetical protein [Candidatus Gracilibacteria bacterium]